MCMPNDTDELARILREADYIDRVIEALNPRSPRARGAQSSAPSLPAAGVGYVDSRQPSMTRRQILHDSGCCWECRQPITAENAAPDGDFCDLCLEKIEISQAKRLGEFERDSQATGV